MAQLVARLAHNQEVAGANPAPASICAMIIVALWDSSPAASPRQAELAALWRRSWLAVGWTPRIMTGCDSKSQRALKDKKKVLSHFGQIARRSVGQYTPVAYGTPGWEAAAVVDFGPDASPELVASVKC